MTVTILEIGHYSGCGKYVLEQYLPVDSIKTGIAIAKEALKEYDAPNTTIEHPRKQVWIINTHTELTGDFQRIIHVKEVSVATINTLKQITTKL